MPPHLRPSYPSPMAEREMFGLSMLTLEPEVLSAELSAIQCRTLAGLIAKILNENEPLLKAESSDATVTVSEIGGCGTFSFTIHRGGVVDER